MSCDANIASSELPLHLSEKKIWSKSGISHFYFTCLILNQSPICGVLTIVTFCPKLGKYYLGIPYNRGTRLQINAFVPKIDGSYELYRKTIKRHQQ